MKFKTLPAILFMIYVFTSCKKDNNNTSSNDPNKLKMYIEDGRNSSFNAIDSFNVTYDNENRVTGIISPNLKTIYTYTSNTSFTSDLYTNNQLSIHEIGYVNSALSLVDSTFQYNDTNDSTTEGYIYNGNLLTRQTTYDYSALSGSQIDMQDDYTYDNMGNVIKDIQSDGFGNINTITTFTYTNKTFNYRLEPPYIPLSKYMPATETQTDGSGTEIISVNFTYQYDSSGRVIKETDTADNGDVIVKSFIYY